MYHWEERSDYVKWFFFSAIRIYICFFFLNWKVKPNISFLFSYLFCFALPSLLPSRINYLHANSCLRLCLGKLSQDIRKKDKGRKRRYWVFLTLDLELFIHYCLWNATLFLFRYARYLVCKKLPQHSLYSLHGNGVM